MSEQPGAGEPTATEPSGDAAAVTDDKKDLRESFRAALDRKSAKNSHVENHLDGHSIGGQSNDTRKRQFRRKSG